MKKNIFNTLSLSALLLMLACGQSQSQSANIPPKSSTNNDSISLMQTFQHLKTDKQFLKDLALENEKVFSWNDNMVKPIFGDLDKDGVDDALIAFIVEGRGGSNSYDMHYAVLLSKNNNWKYQGQFDNNAGAPELFYWFTEIKNGIIQGAIMNNEDEAYSVPAEFIYKNKSFVNTFTALHKTDFEGREYISVSEILTPENVAVPLTATLSEYQKLLGKGKVTEPDLSVECGTYFGEGEYREWRYEHLIFEVSDMKRAAFRTLIFTDSNFKLQTNKGSITANTTLKDIQNVLQANEDWKIIDEEDGSGKTIWVPDGLESDNQLRFHFDTKGKIKSVTLFIPC